MGQMRMILFSAVISGPPPRGARYVEL